MGTHTHTRPTLYIALIGLYLTIGEQKRNEGTMTKKKEKKKSDSFMDEFKALVEEINKPTPVHNESGRGAVQSDDVDAMYRHLDNAKDNNSV